MAKAGAWVWALGLLGLGFLFAGPRGARRAPRTPDRRLTPHFKESDFKRSNEIPALRNYVLNQTEGSNLQQLANLLERLPGTLGIPAHVSSGGRPAILSPRGETFFEILKRKGFDPAENSQHVDFAAADIVTAADRMRDAFRFLVKQPESNQTILYLKTIEGRETPVRIHASIRQPKKGGVFDRPQALIYLDGRLQPYSPVV